MLSTAAKHLSSDWHYVICKQINSYESYLFMIHHHQLSLMKLHLWMMNFFLSGESTDPKSPYMVPHWAQLNLQCVKAQQVLKLNNSHCCCKSSMETSLVLVFPCKRWDTLEQRCQVKLGPSVTHKLTDYTIATTAELHCITWGYAFCFTMLSWEF